MYKLKETATSRRRGGTPNEAVFKDLIEKLSARLDVYNEILSNQKYLAGDVSQPSSTSMCRTLMISRK